MDQILLELMMKERHREMLEEAERRRFVTEYDVQFPSAWESMVTSFANGLIGVGQWLIRRYERSC